MRALVLAVVSALALAACGQGGPGGNAAGSSDAASAGGGLFPNMTGASYRAEGTIYSEDGQTLPVVQIRSGAKIRMEFASPDGNMAVVHTAGEGDDFVLVTRSGRTMAMTTNMSGVENPVEDWNTEAGATATRTGSCSVAGESGAEWSRTDEAGVTATACVTEDGIMLRGTEAGRTVWETQTVTRGPQSADLFVVPPGVQVMNLNNLPGMADALERAKQAAGR